MLKQLVLCALVISPALGIPYFGYSPRTDTVNLFKRVSSGCSANGPTSCQNTSSSGSCCFEAPGGLITQTQFWDTNPVTGPSDSWTIHGLWPDNCDGTYEENCDSSRDYTDIGSLLSAQGASDTLSYMNDYWLSNSESSEKFWEHEWSTHGTCYSTFSADCLPSGSPKGAEAVAFFVRTVELFKSLPTYQWLSDAGITPDSSKTYDLSDFTDALKKSGGVTPALDCDGSAINQIYWYFNLQGSGFDGKFIPIDAPKPGSCKSSGLKYPPKSGGGSTTTPPGGSPTGVPSKGQIQAIVSGSAKGGLLTAGTWSTQTLATVTFSGSSSFQISTSKGSCGVSGGALTCGSGVSASSFTAVKSGSNLLLAYQGSTSWSSDGSPSGSTVEKVYSGSSHSVSYQLNIVSS